MQTRDPGLGFLNTHRCLPGSLSLTIHEWLLLFDDFRETCFQFDDLLISSWDAAMAANLFRYDLSGVRMRVVPGPIGFVLQVRFMAMLHNSYFLKNYSKLIKWGCRKRLAFNFLTIFIVLKHSPHIFLFGSNRKKTNPNSKLHFRKVKYNEYFRININQFWKECPRAKLIIV